MPRFRRVVHSYHVVFTYHITSFYIPFLDTSIFQLKSRFKEHKLMFDSFGQLFLKEFAALYQFYEDILGRSEGNFISEVILTPSWKDDEFTVIKFKLHWMLYHGETFDKNFLLQKCKCQSRSFRIFQLINDETLKNVNTVLSILAVLPVTTATPERSFSTLKRIKNCLRNTIGQN